MKHAESLESTKDSSFLSDLRGRKERIHKLFIGLTSRKNDIHFYKIIQIVRALLLAKKPFYMSVCKHGFRSSFISYIIKEM